MHRVRRKVLPPLPQSAFFDIPDDYKKTIDGERFLLADESPVRRERILMFSSDRQLALLFQSPVIYMDGTFSKSPPHFIQIYMIHGVFIDICRSPLSNYVNSYFRFRSTVCLLPADEQEGCDVPAYSG